MTYTDPMQQQVAVFHDTFGHPNRFGDPALLTPTRAALRIDLLREEGVHELTQAADAHDVVEVIDALIDTVYIAHGTLVELGTEYIPVPIGTPVNFTGTVDETLLFQAARHTARGLSETLDTLYEDLHSGRIKDATWTLSVIIGARLHALRRAGIDPKPFFDEVQRSNMSKLGADGKPIHSRGMEQDGAPEGKVLKGPGYTRPNLAGIYNQLYAVPV